MTIRLIDIAARTGQAPVRALLCAALDAAGPAIVKAHEIRYRNDQFHVLYGLYDDNKILGLVGVARHPDLGSVTVQHLSISAVNLRLDVAQLLVCEVISRQRQPTILWHVPDRFEEVARAVGFMPPGDCDPPGIWTYQLN